MKDQWPTKVPKEPGFYWIRYGSVTCPCQVSYVDDKYVVRLTTMNSFNSNNRKIKGMSNATFGPKITEPNHLHCSTNHCQKSTYANVLEELAKKYPPPQSWKEDENDNPFI